MQSLFRAEFSEDEAQALMEASIFARWIDRTYRPQLTKQGLAEAALQRALQKEARRHLTCSWSHGEHDHEQLVPCSPVMGLQACVQAQQEHEEPSVIRSSRRRLLEDDEAALCQQLMEFLEGFMSDYSNDRYTDPQARLDALELKLQVRRSANLNPNPSSSPSPPQTPPGNPSQKPGQKSGQHFGRKVVKHKYCPLSCFFSIFLVDVSSRTSMKPRKT